MKAEMKVIILYKTYSTSTTSPQLNLSIWKKDERQQMMIQKFTSPSSFIAEVLYRKNLGN